MWAFIRGYEKINEVFGTNLSTCLEHLEFFMGNDLVLNFVWVEHNKRPDWEGLEEKIKSFDAGKNLSFHLLQIEGINNYFFFISQL